jgi:hypothetical protein
VISSNKEWAHLVKPLQVKDGPAGLYPEPRIWAEGKDFEGFGANFSYGFFTESTVCHPIEGALVHPYDEVLVFAGTELDDILTLGGEVSIELGEEREEHIFDVPTVVCIPKGLHHGRVRVKTAGAKTIAHYHFGLAAEYQAEVIPEASLPPRTAGRKHAALVRPLRNNPGPEQLAEIAQLTEEWESGVGVRSAAAPEAAAGPEGSGALPPLYDSRGVLHPRGYVGPGNADSMIWMYGKDLAGFKLNFNWGFFSATGSGSGNSDESHTHPEAEALIWVGLDPGDLRHLGAEIEIALGPDLERHVFNEPTCVVCPSNLRHAPLIVRHVDDPYVFLLGCLDQEYEGRPA